MLRRALSSLAGSRKGRACSSSSLLMPIKIECGGQAIQRCCYPHSYNAKSSFLICRSHGSSSAAVVVGKDDRRIDNEEEKTERQLLFERYADQIVNVSDLACGIRKKVRSYQKRATDSSSSSAPIKLVGILADDDSNPYAQDAKHYSGFIRESCQQDGILYKEHLIKQCHHPWQVEDAIRAANDDDDVHGILVYYPIFKSRGDGAGTINNNPPSSTPAADGGQNANAPLRGPYKNRLTGVYYKSQDDYLRDIVLPGKDVEGLCHEYNARWLFRRNHHHHPHTNKSDEERRVIVAPDQKLVVFPCTALAVYRIVEQELRKQQQKPAASKNENDPRTPLTATIINRSEIFGRPLAAMMANHMGATVYSVDMHSILKFSPGGKLRRMPTPSTTLEDCLQKSSVVVTGVPHPKFHLPIGVIQPSSIVVNVASAEFPNVDEELLLKHVKDVKYVPNVGKVTTAILLQNLISLHRRRILEVKRMLEQKE